jgi:hypothetical protein
VVCSPSNEGFPRFRGCLTSEFASSIKLKKKQKKEGRISGFKTKGWNQSFQFERFDESWTKDYFQGHIVVFGDLT